MVRLSALIPAVEFPQIREFLFLGVFQSGLFHRLCVESAKGSVVGGG
jgi:hypothetical protein